MDKIDSATFYDTLVKKVIELMTTRKKNISQYEVVKYLVDQDIMIDQGVIALIDRLLQDNLVVK